ncbi:hypothetical protein Baya_7403 [Bagarius yarrelli]|uniref:Uncharacterized protein n=1 Tax=Bagarius yarrelli TaxID=175774 RepID=A0A556U102_BAGYA|nr:hypothetical protein Baya_7403 [Bagarius yarrelli]
MLYGPHVCGEALHIDPSSNQILSGSWRKYNTLEVWDYSSGEKVTSVPSDPRGDSMVKSRLFDLPSAVFSASICPSGTCAGLIAATSGDQVFLVSIDRANKKAP